MRRLIPLLAVAAVGLALCAGSPWPSSPTAKAGRQTYLPANCYAAPDPRADGGHPLLDWRFPRDATGGAPDAICDAYRYELAGNAICVRSDGGVVSNGATLTLSGSPVQETPPVTCGNGTGCAGLPWIYVPAGSYEQTSLFSGPQIDWSVCADWDTDDVTGFGNLIQNINSGSGFEYIGLKTQFQWGGAPPYLELFKASGFAQFTGFSLQASGGFQHTCAVFHNNGDGLSTVRLYTNGAETGSFVGYVSTPYPAPSTVWRFFATGNGPARFRNIFVTEKALCPDVIAGMASMLHGQIVPVAGAPIRSAITSALTGCESLDGGGFNFTGANPCVNEGGLYRARVVSGNSLLYSEDLANVAWTKSGGGASVAPTGLSNAIAGPHGRHTASRMSFDAVSNPGDYSLVSQAFAASATRWSCSVWALAASGAPTLWVDLHDQVAGTDVVRSCTLSSSAWRKCSITYQTLTANVWELRIGTDLRSGTGESATPLQTIYLSSAQCSLAHGGAYSANQGSVISAFAPTVQTANPLTLADQANFCLSTTVAPQYDWSTVQPDQPASSMNLMTIGSPGGNNSVTIALGNGDGLNLDGSPNRGTVLTQVYGNGGFTYRIRQTKFAPPTTPCTFTLMKQGRELFAYACGRSLSPLGDNLQPVNNPGDGVMTAMPSTVQILHPYDAWWTKYTIDNNPYGCGTAKGKRIAILGDSIFYGPATMPQDSVGLRLQTHVDAGTSVYNYAIGGQRCDEVAATQWNGEAADAGFDVAFVMCAINDACQGLDAGTIVANQEALYEAIEAQGAQVIPVIASPWKYSGCWSQSLENVTEAVRASQLSLCASHGRICVDSVPLLGGGDGGDQAVLLEPYSFDGVHLTDAGVDRLGDQMWIALDGGGY